jgi:hypothetical protein
LRLTNGSRAGQQSRPGWAICAPSRTLPGSADGCRKANTRVIANYTAAQLATGYVTRWIDTTKSRFVRTQVLDSSGAVIGLSNPVWLLRSTPPGGIPAPRRA